MTGSQRRLSAQPLTVDAFAPFGWIPVADTDPADAGFTYEFEWSDVHVNVIAHAPDEVVHVDGRMICDRFYRHDTHTQTLLPLDVPSVIAVAPAEIEFATLDDLDRVRAFRLQPLDGFALGAGHVALGAVPTRRSARPPLECAREALCRRQPLCGAGSATRREVRDRCVSGV